MKPEERRERIAAVVREVSRASVDELASMLEISRETVRRDLALLSEQGVLRKVHGGAVHFQTAREGTLRDREASARNEKVAIGRGAARLFEPGDSLFIDAGTTTSYFAVELGKVGSFAVITNSVVIASQLWNARHRSEVYLLGGRYFGENQEVVGPLTVEQVHDLHADHVVLTIGAMDETGTCMDFNADEAFVAADVYGVAARRREDREQPDGEIGAEDVTPDRRAVAAQNDRPARARILDHRDVGQMTVLPITVPDAGEEARSDKLPSGHGGIAGAGLDLALGLRVRILRRELGDRRGFGQGAVRGAVDGSRAQHDRAARAARAPTW